MPAVLTKDAEWTLWAQGPGGWSWMDSGPSRDALERKAAGLRALFTNRRFVVCLGRDKPA
jgi:hypothetical protein